MAYSEKSSEGMTVAANKLILHTHILHEGQAVPSHILLLAQLIDRITHKALAGGIDGYVGEDTKAGAIEAWIGRFATGEIDDRGLGLYGWSANFSLAVAGSDVIDPRRTLPFLTLGEGPHSYSVSDPDKDPENFARELDFTPRAMAFLLDKSIISPIVGAPKRN